MNTLGRSIEKGEVVILDKNYFDASIHSDLRFRCDAGYGMHNFTAGTALFGVFLIDGESDRIEGTMIDAKATEHYQQKHGKFLTDD